MLKLLLIAGWVFFAIDAFIVIAAIASRDMGSDAAGRGLASGLGLVALVPLLIGGVALYFGGRANSWLGVSLSFVLLALPFLIFFGVEVEGFFHDARVRMSNSTLGRFPEPAQRELADAIGTANFERMRKILATHPNLNGRNGAGFDLLGYAVTLTLDGDRADCQRQVEAVRLLLEAGMDPNQSRDHDGTPMFSILSFHLGEPPAQQVFRLFLEHGANPDGLDGKEPPIFNAWECVDCVRALLDHGANMEIRNSDGDTPLLFYLFNGRWDGALLLLEKGADLRAQNNHDTTVDTAIEQARRWIAQPPPDGYTKAMAALDRRRATKAH